MNSKYKKRPLKISEIMSRIHDLYIIIQKEEAEKPKVDNPHNLPFPPGWEKTCVKVPAQVELEQFLTGQSAAVIYTLTTITYAGGGDFPLDDFSAFLARYEEVGETFPKPHLAVIQMLGKRPNLLVYLGRGMDMLKCAGVDIDAFLQ